MTVTTLPRSTAPTEAIPHSARWSPSRAGLLNVWRYYDEVLTFSGGRLLLRGANGTGKSKALELLLPFLLDASLRPQRLSTFGTGERTMHWNLMGEGASGVTRVGYVWVEFRGPDEQWFTCGARLQATAHRSDVGVDYFTTSRRVGDDLALTTDAGAPLTKAQLDEALGDEGTRHASAAEYRAAVRRRLFAGMSEERYDALITALLQLRTPKLSQRLDPALLSTLLSRALPPLGESEVTDLAEGFERLDRQREHLARLDEEVIAAKDIAARQRTYARRVLRAGAAVLISATSEMDGRTRAARRSEAEHAEALAGRVAAEGRLRELEQLVEAGTTRLDALRDSPAYQQGTALEDLRAQLRGSTAAATAARERVGPAERTAVADAETAEDARRRAETVDGLHASRRDEATAAAQDAGLGTTAARVEDTLADPDRRERARRLAHAAVESRRHQIHEVGRHLDTWERAVDRRTEVEADLDHARAALAEATTTRASASDRFDTALTAQAERLEQWASATRELTGIDVDALLAAAHSESRVLTVVHDAEQQVRRALDVDEAAHTARRVALTGEQLRVRAERDRVEAERDVPPPVPATRTADRTGRAGAPLWRLVTFVDGVDAERQAAVEAALEAGGLLDAWVSPSGAVEVAGHDTLFRAIAPAPGPSLLEVVVPEAGADSAVEPELLRRLLGSIAYGDDLDTHPAVISPDGRFRLASLTGSWSKHRAAHIGAGAREQARRRRLAELAGELSALDAALAEVDAELAGLARRRGVLDAECAARPDHREPDQARGVLTRAEAALAEADGAVRRWMQRRADAEGAVSIALRDLSAQAAEHRLPTERGALEELDRIVGVFGRLADVWIAAAADARHARETSTRAAEHALRSREAAAERAEAAEAMEAEARRLGERVAVVERAVGTEYREVMDRIAATRAELETARREEHTTRSALRTLDMRIGELEAARLDDARRRDEAASARDAAAGAFRARCLLGLPADAGIELTVDGDGTRMTLETARTVASTWAEVPHTAPAIAHAYGRLTETLHGSRDTLAGRADLLLETEDDVQVLRAVVDGRTLGAAALLARVEAEAERSRSDITAAERELFDTTLTGETRRHLAARIREADALVKGMNERLAGVRTASRVAVRLRWTMADDVSPGTRSARDLLLRDPVRLSADDRASLHRFFRDRIDTARAEGTAGNWEQQLAEVFDYTRWHQFVVEIDRGDGRDWQKLTKKLHGALSGGEKAIALHLPLFAAVAAYYESVPRGPRLILLDEVFVGVDATNRGQVFGLLAALDLDLVLTSDHEWCTYRELDDIAIHQLITGAADEDDAVTTARFVWNGHQLREDA